MVPEESKPPTKTIEPPTDACASGSNATSCAADQNNGAVFRVKLVAEINGNVSPVNSASDCGPSPAAKKRDSNAPNENAASTSKRCRTSSADEQFEISLTNAEGSLNIAEEDANADEDAASPSKRSRTSNAGEQIEIWNREGIAEADANVDEDAASTTKRCRPSNADEQIEISLNNEGASLNIVSVVSDEGAEKEKVIQKVEVDTMTVHESTTESVRVGVPPLNIKTEFDETDNEPKPSSSCVSSSSNINPTTKPATVIPAVKVEKVDASSTSRESCKFGIRCYRRNPMHRIEEAHPGDHDYKRPSYPPPPDDTPDCPFGDSCYRRNPVHFQQYKHPPDTDFAQNYKNHRMRLRERRQQQQMNGMNDDSNNASGNSSDLDDFDLDDPFIDDEDSEYVPSDGVDDDEEDYDECDKAEE